MREFKFKVWNGKEIEGPYFLNDRELYWSTLRGDTQMQYTGLKDKNGFEIYEGDKIRYYEEEIGIVIFEYGSFVIEGTKTGHKESFYKLNGLAEVIGNIYENKELLGE